MEKEVLAGARIKKICKILGPGLVTGASDDDPSDIATTLKFNKEFLSTIVAILGTTTSPYLFSGRRRQWRRKMLLIHSARLLSINVFYPI